MRDLPATNRIFVGVPLCSRLCSAQLSVLTGHFLQAGTKDYQARI